MVNVAVIGFGVVGSGVVEIIHKNRDVLFENTGEDIAVKKILDIREFPESEYGHLITNNADDIFNDPDISIIIETMGGTRFAYDYSKRALTSGKNLVTSNKEMVAQHGPEMIKLAEENNVRYLFEASVGGGIPIIRPLSLCLAANRITEIFGILNGTTNYILTKMKDSGTDFDEALKRAQDKGYAEANPAADIEGRDSCRKIAILSSLAYNEFVDFSQLYCEGITKITSKDIKFAENMDMVIKLIGYSRKDENGVLARVSPVMMPKSNSLANVNGVFNAVLVKGDYIGETMFYGKGAGKNATASAVVGDVIDIVKNPDTKPKSDWSKKATDLVQNDETFSRFYVRYEPVVSEAEDRLKVNELFGSVEHITVIDSQNNRMYAFVTNRMKEAEFVQLSKQIKGIQNFIRVLD